MSDTINVATDVIFAGTLLCAVVVLWLAYRDLVDRILSLQSARIVELQIEIEKLKRSAPIDDKQHDQAPRPSVAAPRVIEKQAALQQ